MYDDPDTTAGNYDAPLMRRSPSAKDADLNALRDLANVQAKVAISKSVRMQNRDMQLKGLLNYACAAVAALCGFACFLFVPGLAKLIAVAMTAIVSTVYFKEGKRLFYKADYGISDAADDDEPEPPYEDYEEPEYDHEYQDAEDGYEYADAGDDYEYLEAEDERDVY